MVHATGLHWHSRNTLVLLACTIYSWDCFHVLTKANVVLRHSLATTVFRPQTSDQLVTVPCCTIRWLAVDEADGQTYVTLQPHGVKADLKRYRIHVSETQVVDHFVTALCLYC